MNLVFKKNFIRLLLALFVGLAVFATSQTQAGPLIPLGPASTPNPNMDDGVDAKYDRMQSRIYNNSIEDLFPIIDSFFSLARYAEQDDDKAYFAERLVTLYELFHVELKREVLTAFIPFDDGTDVSILINNEVFSVDNAIRSKAAGVLYVWDDFTNSLPILFAEGYYPPFQNYPKESMRDTLEARSSTGSYKQRIYCAYALESLGDTQTIQNVASHVLQNAPVVSTSKDISSPKYMAMQIISRFEIPGLLNDVAKNVDDTNKLVRYTALDLLISMFKASEPGAQAALQNISITNSNFEIRRQAKNALEQ